MHGKSTQFPTTLLCYYDLENQTHIETRIIIIRVHNANVNLARIKSISTYRNAAAPETSTSGLMYSIRRVWCTCT